ncbi:hypothetical protein C1T17_15640 [Sphingobium sp. SCG-1]|uniref:hypothetical protein n=1 Tax=Sphingobium sp. SCG-1 TaxID=2072936 RepID=UPI000CD68698|nr:hypothetical protein [Sphingobium sp. SCG-1]AUW59308.1 hypothetical protein C1T17_15640 [Sphingobium sp. SCG-1]
MKRISLLIAVAMAGPMLVAGFPAVAQSEAPLSIETPIETLMASPLARPVLDKELPDLDKHPMYEKFKGMTLVQLQPISSGQISEEKVATIKDALAKTTAAK